MKDEVNYLNKKGKNIPGESPVSLTESWKHLQLTTVARGRA